MEVHGPRIADRALGLESVAENLVLVDDAPVDQRPRVASRIVADGELPDSGERQAPKTARGWFGL